MGLEAKMEDKNLRYQAIYDYLRGKEPTGIRILSADLEEKYGNWCRWASVCKKMAADGLIQVDESNPSNPKYFEQPSWAVIQNNLRMTEQFQADQWRTIEFTRVNCNQCQHAKQEEEGISCDYPIPVVQKDGFCYPHNVVLGEVKPTLDHSQHMRRIAIRYELEWRNQHKEVVDGQAGEMRQVQDKVRDQDEGPDTSQ
jgi:hypothetical protein